MHVCPNVFNYGNCVKNSLPGLTVNEPGGYGEFSDSLLNYHTAFLPLLGVSVLSKTLKYIIQKNTMIQAIPLSQQRCNLSFLIPHNSVNVRRFWWADFVVSGQRQAGCLQLGSVGRLHAAVSCFIRRHEGGIKRFICQWESKKKVQFTKFGLLCKLFHSNNNLQGSAVK